jgi:type II secretory pathway pseudopilin PulG
MIHYSSLYISIRFAESRPVFAYAGDVIMKKTTRTLKGFTLIELGVAICIVSILTSVIVPNLNEHIIDANKASDISNAKLIYEDTMIVLGTNQDAAISFYNQDCSVSPQIKEPEYEWVTLPDGTKVRRFKGMKKYNATSGPMPVARMVGVTRSTFTTYTTAQKLYNSGTNNKNNQDWQTKDYYDGMWEDTGVGDYGKKPVRNRAENSDLSKKENGTRKENGKTVTTYGRTDSGHSVFIKALSEKENIPLYGDQYEPGTIDPNTGKGKPVSKDKPYYPMRYTTHPRESVEERKYCYKWIIDYDRDTMQVGVKAGWQHMDQNGIAMNCYHLYPDTCVEYRDEQFYEVK